MKRILIPVVSMLFTLATITGCTNYGKKVKADNLEVYYKDGVTQAEAEKTLAYLGPKWKDSENKSRKSVQLTRNGDTVNFRMVANMEVMEKLDEELFYIQGSQLSADVFNNAPVNVVLADKTFKTIRTYSFRKTEMPDYGEKVTSGNIEVYSEAGFDQSISEAIAKYLDEQDETPNRKSFQVGMENGNYFVSMVSNREKAKSLTEDDILELAATISNGALNGAPIIMKLTDQKFVPFRTVNYKLDDQGRPDDANEKRPPAQ